MTQSGAGESRGLLAAFALGFYCLPLVIDLDKFLEGTKAANGDGIFVLYLVGYAAPAWIMFFLCTHPLHHTSNTPGTGVGSIARIRLVGSRAFGLLVDAVIWASPLAVLISAELGTWELAILVSFVLFGFGVIDMEGLGRVRRPILVIGTVVVCTGLFLGIAGFAVNTNAIASASTPARKVELASIYVRNSFYATSYGRFQGDVWGFVFTGLGQCQENANIESWLLNQTGMTSHIVSLPGEDHAFVEVNINGTWYSSDPGYNVTVATRWERGMARLAEMGGLSLVGVEGASSLTFLTDQYVPTDTVTIQVFKAGKPYANGFITLNHQFHGGPQGTVNLLLDDNGTYVIRLGSMNYNPAPGTDHFYWVYVNGVKTNYTVTSYGNYSSSYTAAYVPQEFGSSYNDYNGRPG